MHQKTISYKFFKRRLKKIKAFRIIKFKSKKKVLNQNLETFKYLWHLFSPISIDNGLNETLERANYIFPKKAPKFIITSTAFFSDEIFNMYTAKAIENKINYKIIQHGGGFGFSEFNDEEELQISVADEFLTWGWDRSYVSIPKDTKRAKIIPFGSLLLPSKSAKNRSNKPRNTNHKKEIYICISEWSFNDFRLYCYPTSHGQKRKQKDLINMVSSLEPKIRENVSFRLHANGIYNLREILTKELGTFKFNDRAKDDVSDGLLSNARLYIGDSNSTTWLESLVINIPTLLFLSDEYLDHNKNILVINKAVNKNDI